jgi:hypothetical protein
MLPTTGTFNVVGTLSVLAGLVATVKKTSLVTVVEKLPDAPLSALLVAAIVTLGLVGKSAGAV